MAIQMPEVTVWAEEGGYQLKAVGLSGVVVLTIIKDGQPITDLTIGRWRWDRIIQATLPPPNLDLEKLDG